MWHFEDDSETTSLSTSQRRWMERWSAAEELLAASKSHSEADALTHSVRMGNHEGYYARVGKRLKDIVGGKPKSLLDVGCGTGHWLEFFHNEYGLSFNQMAGVDIGRAAVDYARRRCPGVDIRQVDVGSSMLWSSWALAIGIGVLHHMTVRDHLVLTFKHVLSASPRFIVFPTRLDGEVVKATNSEMKRFWKQQDYIDAAREATHGKVTWSIDPAKPRFLVFAIDARR